MRACTQARTPRGRPSAQREEDEKWAGDRVGACERCLSSRRRWPAACRPAVRPGRSTPPPWFGAPPHSADPAPPPPAGRVPPSSCTMRGAARTTAGASSPVAWHRPARSSTRRSGRRWRWPRGTTPRPAPRACAAMAVTPYPCSRSEAARPSPRRPGRAAMSRRPIARWWLGKRTTTSNSRSRSTATTRRGPVPPNSAGSPACSVCCGGRPTPMPVHTGPDRAPPS